MPARIIKIVLIAVLGLGVIFGLKHYSKSKPNIILVTFDALRADHLGCYGYAKDTSLFLDTLSKDSLTFTNCITQSASTVPAISAIFTGRYPYLDGAVTKDYTLGQKYTTIAEFLKQRGYQTFAFPGHFYVKKKFGFSRGFDYFAEDYADRLNASETSMRVINLFKNKTANNKFFLWIHIREPHAPITLRKNILPSFYNRRMQKYG
jgi:arylsulfatase